MTPRLLPTLFAAALAVGACGSSAPTVGTDGSTIPTSTAGVETTVGPTTSLPVPVDADEQGALDEARDRWRMAALTDYQYVLYRRCECPPEWVAPHRVVVIDGEVVAELLEPDRVPPPGPAMSIEEIFEQIQQAIDAGSENSVTYDTQTGAPQEVQLDLPGIAADGGFDVGVEMEDLSAAILERDAAERQWDANGISAHELTYRVDCFCPENVVTVTVVDGIATAFEVAGDTPFVTEALTVDDMFAAVDNAQREGAASVRVSFDPELGYVTGYFVDVSEMMADEEQGVTVLSLTPSV